MKLSKMNRQLVVATVTLLASGIGYAAVASASIVDNAAEASLTSGGCTNFAGNWRGACSTNGQPGQPDAIAITQSGCETMEFGDQGVVIGGSKTTERVVGNTTITTILTTAWNQNKTELGGKYAIIQREAGQPGQKYAEVAVWVRLDAGRLVTMAQGNGGTVQCVYERQ